MKKVSVKNRPMAQHVNSFKAMRVTGISAKTIRHTVNDTVKSRPLRRQSVCRKTRCSMIILESYSSPGIMDDCGNSYFHHPTISSELVKGCS